MKETVVKTELCVIGGGISGLCAAVAAARRGVKVVLVQDRNVLGGNASSEIRMWIRGAGLQFPAYKEGGLIEELALDNMHFNPQMNYSIWDGVLYNKAASEKNIDLMLGCTCIGAEENNKTISCIEVWELASYRKYKIFADYFADCSGDCILSEFTDTLVMSGRESRAKYGEDKTVLSADKMTMGNSCMLQLKKAHAELLPHYPFPFERHDAAELCAKRVDLSQVDNTLHNFWWLETGGEDDALRNAGEINRNLIALNFAVYSEYLRCNENNKEKWFAEWIGFLAGKRETRRYEGDYVLTQGDLENSKEFFDEIAYGGWSMDDHDPRGICAEIPNIHHRLEKPYAIPYRCLYSKNIKNLFFAGRNISVTHMALSSTRVMATCGMLGQAVGTACALAKKHNVDPRGVLQYIDELKSNLLNDDCYLLHTERKNMLYRVATESNFFAQKEVLPERDFSENCENAVKLGKNERIYFLFEKRYVGAVRLVFDSDLMRKNYKDQAVKLFPMLCYVSDGESVAQTPPSLVKDYEIEIRKDGKWEKVKIEGNFHRLNIISIGEEIEGIAFKGIETHGDENIRLYSVDILEDE